MIRQEFDLVPVVYEHAAALIGRTPRDVSRSGDLLFRAHAEAFRVYGHRPVTVGIDIYNLEAEAYGATVGAPEGNALPTIAGHPFSSCREIEGMKAPDPERDGRLPMVIETAARLLEALPGADVRVPVSGPFSLAANLLGFDRLLCEIMDCPESVAGALERLALNQGAFCRAIAARGAGIVLFDSGSTPPLISPAFFRRLVLPGLRQVVTHISAFTGRGAACVIGGNTAPILDALLETGAGYLICPCETDQALFMEKMRRHPQVTVRVNMNPGVFAPGSREPLDGEVRRVVSLAAGRENTDPSTGALPLEADPARVREARRLARDEAMPCDR